MPPLTPRERALTEELDECNETVRQLRAEALTVPVCRYRGFSPCEAGIIGLLSLVPGRVHTAETVRAHLDASYGYRDGTTIKSAQVTICRLRAKLRRLLPAVTIETNGWNGYSMTAESVAVMDGLLLV
jgi:DNA-binding response OmpR family regulator